jgi:putative nucleotide binding protein
LRLIPEVGPIQADGSLGELLRSGAVGEMLQEKIHKAILNALQKGTDLSAHSPQHLLAVENEDFETGEKLRIGREGRAKILSVFGKLAYEDLTAEAKTELLAVCEMIVKNNEARYVAYFNELQPLTPRLHGLELIPGIGKTFMKEIIDMREKQRFTSFDDIQERVGLRDPAKMIAKRIVEELAGDTRVAIFVKK